MFSRNVKWIFAVFLLWFDKNPEFLYNGLQAMTHIPSLPYHMRGGEPSPARPLGVQPAPDVNNIE